MALLLARRSCNLGEDAIFAGILADASSSFESPSKSAGGDPTIAIGNVAKLLWVIGADLDARASRDPALEEVKVLFADTTGV